jgi:hypothetical protein
MTGRHKISSSQAEADGGRRTSGTSHRATTLIARSRRYSATVRKLTLVAVTMRTVWSLRQRNVSTCAE